MNIKEKKWNKILKKYSKDEQRKKSIKLDYKFEGRTSKTRKRIYKDFTTIKYYMDMMSM